MSFLKSALELAAKGFYVFPLIPNAKEPLILDFTGRATRDEKQIRNWWTCPVLGYEKDFNIGIATSKFGDNEALIVVDIDNKPEKNGYDSLFILENVEGKTLPETWKQKTPTGGSHLIYRHSESVKQGVNVLGLGLDTRSRGGYIVGAGSILRTQSSSGRTERNRHYSLGHDTDLPVLAPQWLIEECGKAKEKEAQEIDVDGIDPDRARARAQFYLENDAPIAVKGQGGDQTTFAVAAHLKDFGVEPSVALELMLDFWNDRCPPGWSPERLKTKIDNAYRYGKEQVGSLAPEASFEPIKEDEKEAEKKDLHPFEKLNEEWAFVLTGGSHHILHETKDAKGRFLLEHVQPASFHAFFAWHQMQTGDGDFDPVTRLWMKSKNRRTYNGICFLPGKPEPKGWYNLWRGFSVEPKLIPVTPEPTDEGYAALQMFLGHAEQNICNGDKDLTRWLLGFFAHLIQKPWEKPLVAPVFRGGKGVGKGALVNFMGNLIRDNYVLTGDKRYFLGNFNAHLENCLMLTLDEAFWSGNKDAEGPLKFLITEKTLRIERKGQESYPIDNQIRVVIIGNEDWMVPASADERRFAVFNVGNARRGDTEFFEKMRLGLEAGGYQYLLQYLKDFDLSTVNVNKAPMTEGLLDQKISSFNSFERFWHETLLSGKIGNEQWNGSAIQVDKEIFRNALYEHLTVRRENSWRPHQSTIGKSLACFAPSVDRTQKRANPDGTTTHVYRLPDLITARREWEHRVGHKIDWEKGG